MTTEEWDTIWRGLVSVWPRAFDRDDDGELSVIWRSYFMQHDYSRVIVAVRAWMGEHSKAPTIADIRAGIRAAAKDRPKITGYPEPRCSLCEYGWVEVDTEGRSTVQRCPNGCKPPRMGMSASHPS